MKRISTILIGDETLLIGCGDQLLERGHEIRAVVSDEARIRDWAGRHGLAIFAAPEALLASGVAADWLFSIANLWVLPDAVLGLAGEGAINFHDGPLPGYAGLNTPVWALMAGERHHGVTWHMMTAGIDRGDIVLSREFAIAEDETAHTLNSKCYAAGLDSFADLLSRIETESLAPRPQNPEGWRYFSATRRPEAAGVIDVTQGSDEIVRRVRALDFSGYWNPLGLPRLAVSEALVPLRAARPVAAAAGDGDARAMPAPGEVLAVGEDSVTVATADGAVELSRFGQPIEGALRAGEAVSRLSAQEAEALREEAERLAPHQDYWRRRLAEMAPVTVPLAAPAAGASRETGWTWEAMETPQGMPRETLVTVLGLWAAQGAGVRRCDLAWLPRRETAGRLAAPWVPLPIEFEPDARLSDAARTVAEALAEIEARPGFADDLALRDPALAGLTLPQMVIAEGAGEVPGAVIRAELDEDRGLRIGFDGERLDEAARGLLLARLRAMLSRASEATQNATLSVADVQALPATERERLIEEWNATEAAFDPELTIPRAFEAQVARTPEATALVFEDRAFSYAELNDRANRVAAALRAEGVGPGVNVGLCLQRSAELVIGALAILKAGGAYVPLDSDHPAGRLAHILHDSAARLVLAHGPTAGLLPAQGAKIIDIDTALADIPTVEGNVDGGAGGEDLAYLIYTSGSTGRPKGVMVTHRNVANFFRGMDDCVDREAGNVWLAVTSIGFDISVLEIFYTLARGFKVVLSGGETRAAVSQRPIARSGRKMDFSIYFWGNDDGPGRQKYQLLLDAARFADEHGFCAIWTPERHFHAFGGPYPNPAVSGAAVAAVTGNIGVRAGSIVAPLHHPARIAEDWAMIDNLTEGRAGLGLASGWHPHDFVLRPENSPPDNKRALFDTLDKLRRLWRGEAVEFPDRDGKMIPTRTVPRPVSAAPECWVTIAGNPETWRMAGEHGCHVLTHLLGQSVAEVGERIKLYHAALREAGHDPADFKVTLMLHSYIAEDRETARKVAHGPMKAYMGSAAGLIKQFAWVFPAFRRPEGVNSPFEMDLDTLAPEEVDAILEFAFERYFEDSGLFGSVEDGVARAEELRRIGVTEIACLIDYGIETPLVLEGLERLRQVMEAANAPADLADDDFSLAAQLIRHRATHLQCTPSMARILTQNDEARAALRHLRQILLGGEALPGDLVEDLRGCTGAAIRNMYGPTETTVWSTSAPITTDDGAGTMPIGRPIANTSIHVLDEAGQPSPVGVAGELCIGGEGVSRGYWRRDGLTAERFVPDPFAPGEGARLYRTGDMARWRADGTLEFLGRNDHQIKIRGQRIELGEIEAAMTRFATVTEAVALPRQGPRGDTRLVGYYTAAGPVDEAALRTHLAALLPPAMVPAELMRLDAMPLTPNRKIDRKALPEPVRQPPAAVSGAAQVPAASDLEIRIAAIWSGVLGVSGITPADNFFDLGGHSLLAVQAHRELRSRLGAETLSITDIFRFPVLRDLARHIGKATGAAAASAPETALQGAEEGAAGAQTRAATISRRRAMRAGRTRETS